MIANSKEAESANDTSEGCVYYECDRIRMNDSEIGESGIRRRNESEVKENGMCERYERERSYG